MIERDWPRQTVEALVAALDDPAASPGGRLSGLMDEAIAHLDRILREQPNAAVAVPVAVFRTLSANPVPTGLLASAAATYLARMHRGFEVVGGS